MKTFYFIFLFMISNFTAQCQRESFLYNEKGQLRLDTTLTISKAQYKTWTHAEINLVAGFSNIEFPQIYLENGIKSKNILIVSFECDTSDIKEIKVLNDTSVFALSVIKGLQKQGIRIAALLKSRSHFSSEAIYMGKYYLAIDFMLIDFYEQLKNKKAVPIIKSSIPVIDVMSH